MWRKLGWASSGLLAMLTCGCVCTGVGPAMDNPSFIRVDPNVHADNPLYIAMSPESYNKVFEKIYDVLTVYFDIAYANRYDGRIETFPRIAPGFERFWVPGNPDNYKRLLSTLQTYRNRAVVLIQPAEDGGFFVNVTVYFELEDLQRPQGSTIGPADFRVENNVDHANEVVEPTMLESNWIPQGRNTELEQQILQRLKGSL